MKKPPRRAAWIGAAAVCLSLGQLPLKGFDSRLQDQDVPMLLAVELPDDSEDEGRTKERDHLAGQVLVQIANDSRHARRVSVLNPMAGPPDAQDE